MPSSRAIPFQRTWVMACRSGRRRPAEMTPDALIRSGKELSFRAHGADM